MSSWISSTRFAKTRRPIALGINVTQSQYIFAIINPTIEDYTEEKEIMNLLTGSNLTQIYLNSSMHSSQISRHEFSCLDVEIPHCLKMYVSDLAIKHYNN